jgi:hypothetical protein
MITKISTAIITKLLSNGQIIFKRSMAELIERLRPTILRLFLPQPLLVLLMGLMKMISLRTLSLNTRGLSSQLSSVM